MSLEHAILGFLNYGPFTGYDLKKVFDRSVNHFWPADRSQIYRTLSRLADGGLATVEVVHQEDAPDRKVYHITERGRAELHAWLNADCEPESVRSAELVRVFFAGQLSDEQALTMLKRGLQKYEEFINTYDDLRQQSQQACAAGEAEGTPVRDLFFWQLTLENGLVTTRALVEWIKSVIDRLEREDYTLFPHCDSPLSLSGDRDGCRLQGLSHGLERNQEP